MQDVNKCMEIFQIARLLECNHNLVKSLETITKKKQVSPEFHEQPQTPRSLSYHCKWEDIKLMRTQELMVKKLIAPFQYFPEL